MEETKKLAIPDGYEFDRVENGEVILKKKEVVLPKTFEKCSEMCIDDLTAQVLLVIPRNERDSINAICQLLVCRNAWWKQLGWKPDWKKNREKYCIYSWEGNVVPKGISALGNHIIAFPTPEVRDQFYVAFKDLIEEAKELL